MQLVGAKSSAAVDLARGASVLTLGARLALNVVDGTHVRLFPRCPVAHSIIVGPVTVAHSGSQHSAASFALPAHTPHSIVASAGPIGVVAFLDARRYRFEDAQRLAHAWRGFVPGRDDPREAFGDALKRPRRRLDARLEAALEILETENTSVLEAALRVGLSESRLTHLMTDTLGAPPRKWRPWLKLRNAIGEVALHGANYTQAAHRAGFADSAHFTRTSKALIGVTPTNLVASVVYVTRAI